MADALWQDVRHALRHVRRSKGFSSVVVVTLALGIGANAALYTLLNAIVLQKLPVPDADRLAAISLRDPTGAQSRGMFHAAFLELRERQTTFETLFAYTGGRAVTVESRGATASVTIEGGTPEYYSVLGLRPVLGRVISAEDLPSVTQPAPVAMISHRFWLQHFGGDPSVIGERIEVEGTPLTVIGVMPRGFRGIQVELGSDLFVPLTLVRWVGATTADRNRPMGAQNAMGKLRKGVTLAQARAEIETLWGSLRTMPAPAGATPVERAELPNQRIRVESVSTGISLILRPRYADPLRVLTGLTVLLLAIACVNLSGLLLARAAAREQAMAVCLALGASGPRLVQQLLVESLLLSAAGAVAALPLSWWASRMLVPMIWGASLAARAPSVAPDLRLIGTLAAVAVGCGILVGVLPAWAASRARPFAGLQSGRTVASASGRWGKAVLVVQVALSVVLLFGTGLFARSLAALRGVDLGFSTEHVAWTRLAVKPGGYENFDESSYYPQLVRQISQLSGVEAVGLAYLFPGYWSSDAARMLRPVAAEDIEGAPEVRAIQDALSPGFFETMQSTLLEGRDFTWHDDRRSPMVAIVNDTLRRKLFPSGNALGRRIRLGADPKVAAVEIVGIARDGSYGNLRVPHVPVVFRPLLQETARIPILIVRSKARPAALLDPVRGAVASLGREYVRTLYALDGTAEEAMIQERLLAAASTLFGGLALLLAYLGLYALQAYAVARRTREVGVRMALGASRSQIVSMVVSEGFALTALGIALGVPCALGAGRLVGALLVGIAPFDPASLAAAAVFLVAVGLGACFIPARRACAIDPMAALRCE
jgi:predicted permease